ncbi:methyltransferase domain-containing protein [Gammaproteobacteria bacterium LSUCC0057]|uniref:Methyltransferase domain-containing protein n=1 Tax=Gammaproteobacteria bacterium LSUCC0057 TaxID=2559237 RepID=A0A4Y8UKB2_9GAMM|nr:methyltransferase domain-containing protein [Gammaproteobacteria bacterium LSUCC0057]
MTRLPILIENYIDTMALIAAHRLNLFVLLMTESLSIKEIAQILGTNERKKLVALLNYLVAIGALAVIDDVYVATDITRELADTTQPSCHMLELIAEQYMPTLRKLDKALHTNESAFELAFGGEPWLVRQSNPPMEKNFQTWLDCCTDQKTHAFVSEWDWSRYSRLLDVGAGQGALAQIIADYYPNIDVAVFDLPSVISRLEEDNPDSARVHAISGDFFERLPSEYDAYLFKSVLHDWKDESAVKILNVAAQQLNAKGRIIVIERLYCGSQYALNTPSVLQLERLNLMMSAIHGSSERTQVEFECLFARASLYIVQQQSLSGGFTLMELATQPIERV